MDRPRLRRLAPVAAVAALLVAGTTACDPPPVPPTFTTVPGAEGPDVAPGDGICADATGRCSLAAAIDETNALGEARIEGGGWVEDAVLTGRATITGGTWSSRLTVATGAHLAATDPSIGRLRIDGSADLQRVWGQDVTGEPGPRPTSGITIGPTGRAVVRDSFLWGEAIIVNEGQLLLHGSSVHFAYDESVGHDAPALTTRGAGRSTLAASTLHNHGGVDVCAGTPPISSGHNVASDDSCALAGDGDLVEPDVAYYPESAPLFDTIPVGVLGCGTWWTTDQDLRPRPADLDGDGVAACDPGFVEHQPVTAG